MTNLALMVANLPPSVLAKLNRPEQAPRGRANRELLDAATEQDLELQQQTDDAEAMQDVARYARQVRRRLGLTQAEFARRIEVPLNTTEAGGFGGLGITGSIRAGWTRSVVVVTS